MPLRPKQARFVAEYLKDLNATQAAIRAGYTKHRADAAGYQLLRNSEVTAAIQQGTAQQLESADLSATKTKQVIGLQVDRDIRQLFDEQGNLIPIHKMTKEAASMIAGFEILKRNITAGDGQVDVLHKVRLEDRKGYVEMAAKHFGLLEDKVTHSGHLTISFEGGWRPPERE